jgi:hypothetical protein
MDCPAANCAAIPRHDPECAGQITSGPFWSALSSPSRVFRGFNVEIPQPISAISQTVVLSIRRIVSSRTLRVFPMPNWVFQMRHPRKCRARSHLVVTLGLFLFATAPLFAPSDWVNRCGPRISTCHLHFLLPQRLHHSLPQFLQRILRPPPDDAVVPQRQKHRQQQSINKQYGADRVQKKVIWRYRGTPRHSQINQEN